MDPAKYYTVTHYCYRSDQSNKVKLNTGGVQYIAPSL